jgi:hypothetical protein
MKVYAKIRMNLRHSTLIRVDNVKEFKPYIQLDKALRYRGALVVFKEKIKPMPIEVPEEDFLILSKVIQKKIGNRKLNTKKIFLVESSDTVPIISLNLK